MINHGEEVKRIVREKGITDEDFAKMLEITRGGVLDVYKRPRIKHKQLKEIAQKLNINYAQFLDDELPTEEKQKEIPQSEIREFYERIIKEKDAHIEDLRKMLFLMERRDTAQ